MEPKTKTQILEWLESCARLGAIGSALLCAWQYGRTEAAAEQLAEKESELAKLKEKLQRIANAPQV